MSGITKAELLEQLDRVRADADAATDAALNAKRERDGLRNGLTRAAGERDTALRERDMARIQLQETLTSEQQLRDAFSLTEHLNAGLRKQLDDARTDLRRTESVLLVAQKDVTESRAGWEEAQSFVRVSDRVLALEAQLKAERETRSRVEGDLRKQLDAAHASHEAYITAASERDAALRDWGEADDRLEAERATRSRVEGELYTRIRTYSVESVEYERQLEEARFELARTTQTSHDREAALLDAITALARRTP